MTVRRLFLPVLLVCGIAALPAARAVAETTKGPVYLREGVAIGGYDPVAYFAESKPRKGSRAHEITWSGATWRFVSAENRALFESDPGRYAPQYGGYCAYGVSQGYKAPTRADAWSVVDGKLYLNYNRIVRALWSRDTEGYIRTANAKWPDLR